MNDKDKAEQNLALACKLNPSIDEEVRKEGFEFELGEVRPTAAGS